MAVLGTIAAMRTLTLVAACLAGLAGCGSGFDGVSARQGCADIWESVCDRYYECYRPDEIAENGLPPTAAECATQLTAAECGEFTDTACPGGLRYHPAAVYDCTQAILVADCSLIATAPDSVTTCNSVCGQ
jgi:hypothetical protein